MKKYLITFILCLFFASPVWAVPVIQGHMGQSSGGGGFCDGTLACFQAEGSDTFTSHGGIDDCAAFASGDYCDQYAVAAKNGSYGIAHFGGGDVYSQQTLSSNTDSFCAEWWVYFKTDVTQVSMTSFRQTADATHVVSPYLQIDAKIDIYIQDGDTLADCSGVLNTATWYCIKLCYKEETGATGDGKIRLWVTTDGDFSGAPDYTNDLVNTGANNVYYVRWRGGVSGKENYHDDGKVYSWSP